VGLPANSSKGLSNLLGTKEKKRKIKDRQSRSSSHEGRKSSLSEGRHRKSRLRDRSSDNNEFQNHKQRGSVAPLLT